MLALGRKLNQSIILHNGKSAKIATIEVAEIHRGQVVLGIDADRSVCIDRKEVFLSKCGEGE